MSLKLCTVEKNFFSKSSSPCLDLLSLFWFIWYKIYHVTTRLGQIYVLVPSMEKESRPTLVRIWATCTELPRPLLGAGPWLGRAFSRARKRALPSLPGGQSRQWSPDGRTRSA